MKQDDFRLTVIGIGFADEDEDGDEEMADASGKSLLID